MPRWDPDDSDYQDAAAEARFERDRSRRRMNYIMLGPEYHEDWMDEDDEDEDDEDDDDE